MNITYAVFNPFTSTYTKVQSVDERNALVAKIALEGYLPMVQGEPFSVIEVSDDGAEMWRTPAGVERLSPEQIQANIEAQVAHYGDAQYTPVLGQAGKDVVWFPSPPDAVDAMIEVANITPNDVVFELGSGTGVIAIQAGKSGATAFGVEFNQDLVDLANRKAQDAGVADKVTFMQGDLLDADLSSATVVMMYLTDDLNAALKSKLQALPNGTRIVSLDFGMPDWEPTRTMQMPDALVYQWTIGA